MRPVANLAPLLLALPHAGFAQSEPCVGPGFERPLPGAVSVERRATDSPSARTIGFWQEGRVAGYVYQLSSDLSGLLAPGWNTPRWQVTFVCDPVGQSCSRDLRGDVPERADDVATLLERCLLGGEVTEAAFADLNPQQGGGLPPDTGVTDEDRALSAAVGIATAAGLQGRAESDAPAPSGTAVGDTPATDRPAAVGPGDAGTTSETASDLDSLGPTVHPADACGLKAIDPEATPVRQLQTLLSNNGFDAGTIDGIMGQRTRAAMISALGPEAENLSVEDAITALDAEFCGR